MNAEHDPRDMKYDFFEELMGRVSVIAAAKSENAQDKISASEALYGFMGWLTSRDEAVTFSGHHNAAVAADLVALFCEVNDLPEPRRDWGVVRPKERRLMGIEKYRHYSFFQPHLEQILSKLSGSLSHDNVSAAKKMLKTLIDVGKNHE